MKLKTELKTSLLWSPRTGLHHGILIAFFMLSGISFNTLNADENAENKQPNLEIREPEKIDFDKIPVEQFLMYARSAPSQETWAKMEGVATHKRDGARMIKAPVKLGIRFTPSRIIAQIVFNGDEIYNLGQTFTNPPVCTQDIQVKDKNNTQLALYGVSASDLTLGFMYQKAVAELARESVKTENCRVLVMETPTKGEYSKVYISTKYMFPLKVESFKGNPYEDKKLEPYRTLEIGSVKKEKDFWLITGVKLYGPTWRTTIEFPARDAGYAKDSLPADLFQTIRQ